jgi:hypothetical protein
VIRRLFRLLWLLLSDRAELVFDRATGNLIFREITREEGE